MSKSSNMIINEKSSEKLIALTFDDGPRSSITEQLLAILEKGGAKATFFLIGQQVAMFPQLALATIVAGHEVGNHTHTHPLLTKLSDQEIREEIHRAQEAIKSATGTSPRWFRPPYGAIHTKQRHLIPEQGLQTVLWNVDPRDWSRPGVNEIVRAVIQHTRPASIILCHDLYPQTVAALPYLLDYFIGRDYQFLTITELKNSLSTAVASKNC